MKYLFKALFCAALLSSALSRCFPAFARLWRTVCAQPFAAAVSSFSTRIPFPLIEILAAVWAGALVLRALSSLVRSLQTRRRFSLAQGLRAALRGLLLPLLVLGIVYLPLYFVDAPTKVSVSSEQTEALCRALIDALNASELSFTGGEGALRIAERAALLPEGSVKAARYPEWMNRLRLAGFYAPWTGEALVHPDLAAEATPFVACHELMHRRGFADEGQANIAAWQACIAHGGEAATSAKLWALRSAMASLRETNESAWRACVQTMDAPLVDAFRRLNGFSATNQSSPSRRFPALGRLFSSMNDYDALIRWLVAFYEF